MNRLKKATLDVIDAKLESIVLKLTAAAHRAPAPPAQDQGRPERGAGGTREGGRGVPAMDRGLGRDDGERARAAETPRELALALKPGPKEGQ
jgi:hypothetical protein